MLLDLHRDQSSLTEEGFAPLSIDREEEEEEEE
jgi:hypothetical protein